MSSVTELPKGGASLLADQMSMRLGGAGANAALAFAEAGMPVRLVGCLGDDHLGDWTFLTYLGVNVDWKPAMIPDHVLRCENSLLCDYFLAPGLQGHSARWLLETARGHGARTFFDTAWNPDNFSQRTQAEVLDLLTAVDVFLPNEAEACALAGINDGGLSTGAGDAFNAGLLQALSEGYAWPEALRAAVRLASAVVARPSGERYRRGPNRTVQA